MNKFKIGDIVTGTEESDNKYGITNSHMTKGMVKWASEDGLKITIEVLQYNDNDGYVGFISDIHDSRYFKLVKPVDQIDFSIRFDKTNTIVQVGDKTGKAKLYYKDEYNKGYGIVVALGRALGVDLIKDVLEITKKYEEDEMILKKKLLLDFKTGDYVYAKGAFGYNTGKIIEINGCKVYANWSRSDLIKTLNELPKTLSEFSSIKKNASKGYIFIKDCKKLILEDDTKKPPVNFKVGDKVVPHSKTAGEYNLEKSDAWNNAKEKNQPFLYIKRFLDSDTVVLTENNGLKDLGDYFKISDVTLYVEPKETSAEVEIKVGDYAYYESKWNHGKYGITKVTEIRDNSIYGFWSGYVANLPKTIKEFEAIEKSSHDGRMAKVDCKRLVLQDDTPEGIIEDFKAGKVVYHTPTEAEANVLLKYLDGLGFKWNTGKSLIDHNNYSHNKENTVYFGREGVTYDKVDYAKERGCKILTIADLGLKVEEIKEVAATEEEQFEIGQEIDGKQAEKVIKAGGRVKTLDFDGLEYFEKEGKLYYYEQTCGDSISGGYKGNIYGYKFKILSLGNTENQSKYKLGQTLTQDEIVEVLINSGKVKRNDNLEYFLKEHKLYFTYESNRDREYSSGSFGNIQDSSSIYTVSAVPEKIYKVGDEVTEEEIQKVLDLGFKIKDDESYTFKKKNGELIIKDGNGVKRFWQIKDIKYPAKIVKAPRIKIEQ